MFYKNEYSDFTDALNCSAEILDAIETATGSLFRRDDNGEIVENDAYDAWEGGINEGEIVNALPTIPWPEKGQKVFWGGAAWATFDGEKWELE